MCEFKFLLGSALFLPLMFISADARSLAAHRALYELEPQRIDQTNSLMPLGGRIAYELLGSSCEGYTVNYRIANRYEQTEKGQQLIDTQLNSFESGDGLELTLNQKQYVNNQAADEARLNVKRPKAGEDGKGVMTAPKELDFVVRADALFPSAHEARIIDQAVRGESRDTSIVFDGSDGEKLYKAVSFIGKKRAPGTFAIDAGNPEAKPLSTVASWPVTVSYYPLEDDNAATPSYQASFNVYENGVSTNLLLDYGGYALRGKLVKLEMLKADNCPSGN